MPGHVNLLEINVPPPGVRSAEQECLSWILSAHQAGCVFMLIPRSWE